MLSKSVHDISDVAGGFATTAGFAALKPQKKNKSVFYNLTLSTHPVNNDGVALAALVVVVAVDAIVGAAVDTPNVSCFAAGAGAAAKGVGAAVAVCVGTFVASVNPVLAGAAVDAVVCAILLILNPPSVGAGAVAGAGAVVVAAGFAANKPPPPPPPNIPPVGAVVAG